MGNLNVNVGVIKGSYEVGLKNPEMGFLDLTLVVFVFLHDVSSA